jgi:hypothetical protein
MIPGTWTKPATGRTRHYMEPPRNVDFTMRHSLCGLTLLIDGRDDEHARRCLTCERIVQAAHKRPNRDRD